MKLYNIVCAIMLSSVTITVSSCGLIDTGVNKYDTLSEKDEICNLKWADYESQLQRRADLIPNLVAVVKGYAAHEHSTLADVIQARASATQVKLSSEDLTDPVKVEAFKKAQEGLSGALGKLISIQEQYPTLQANEQFHSLMIQMEGTENRILQSRRDYNAAVSSFNFELRRVSGKIINPLTNREFKPRVYFSVEESAKVAPKVDFIK